MLKNLRNKKKKGFTLIELIIVIAIIAILSAIAIPQFGKIRHNANVKTDIANAKTIYTAVSTLIAEDKISADAGVITIGAENPGEAATLVEEYLGNVPKPKAVQSSNFVATVEEEKGVTKIVISVNDEDMYPEATGDVYGTETATPAEGE
ncbi:prepilin-type N-terminal cleavage/methylation domain-containing protein [Clostridium celatum]|uniref:prepilin-type N-terminal cleavage/methylation domain-containing protein n=1 Tax=Clostridium celatum TaxID=36834 RepID=UPI0028FE7640|nr:prepilin-type N-terminal cleavage/methylation domain-containing protein [Clostridium celatum]MDU2266297.1 prepilin-type N-terminal cleavage/methylation domain-containing protein [Clostridium celatum]MDU6296580.1 prepilin-type N-terminal cleavage/methylation domain-containing protein [Clostridium celatum]